MEGPGKQRDIMQEHRFQQEEITGRKQSWREDSQGLGLWQLSEKLALSRSPSFPLPIS